MSPELHVLSMKARRAAIYIGGGALLVAWLAAANTSTRSDPPPEQPTAVSATDRVDDLAARVREESEQLHSRLSQAPSPTANTRNLFSFAPIAAPRAVTPRRSSIPSESDAAPMPPPPLALTLMGIAENPSAAGPQRTAILGGAGDELYMVTVGQTIAARYAVTAISEDAIELKDLATGGFRRLALK